MSRPPTKDRSLVRDEVLHVRLRMDQRKRWEAAASKAGLSLADWLRAIADRAARMT